MERGRRRRISGSVEDTLNELALRGWSAPQIQAELATRYGEANAPLLRTVQRNLKDLLAAPPSGAWTVRDADPTEFALVRDVLSFVVSDSRGRVNQFTQAEVSWMARLRRMASDLPPLATFRLARLYLSRQAHERPTDDLDAWLLFGPYRGDQHRQRYEEAVREGWVRRLPFGFFLLEEQSQRISEETMQIASQAIEEFEREREEGDRE